MASVEMAAGPPFGSRNLTIVVSRALYSAGKLLGLYAAVSRSALASVPAH